MVVQFLEQFLYLFSFVAVSAFLAQLIFKKIRLILFFFLVRIADATVSVLVKIAYILILILTLICGIAIVCDRLVVKNVQAIRVNLNEVVFVFGLIEFDLFLPVFLFAFLYSFDFVFQCLDVFELLGGFRFFMVRHFLVMNLHTAV